MNKIILEVIVIFDDSSSCLWKTLFPLPSLCLFLLFHCKCYRKCTTFANFTFKLTARCIRKNIINKFMTIIDNVTIFTIPLSPGPFIFILFYFLVNIKTNLFFFVPFRVIRFKRELFQKTGIKCIPCLYVFFFQLTKGKFSTS